MSDDDVDTFEFRPLTEDQIAAIRELRFVFTNRARTVAVGLTTDADVARRCPGSNTPVIRSRNPTVVEYDVQMGHPDVIAMVLEHHAARSNA